MKHIQWRYMDNGWHLFCGRWWKHWLHIEYLWADIKDTAQRAFRGWGDGDIFDLLSYHAGVTLGLLKHFKDNHNGYVGESPEEYEAKLDLAIDAWTAKYLLLTHDGWKIEEQTLEEFESGLQDRWEKGESVFYEIYDSLW